MESRIAANGAVLAYAEDMLHARQKLSLVGLLCLVALGVVPHAAQALTVTRFPAFRGFPAFGGDITAGPGGALWFTDAHGIGRITTSGVVSEFPVADTRQNIHIVTGPDGNLWFTRNSPDNVGPPTGTVAKMTPSGAVTEFSTGISGAYVGGITAGPDGNLWFTEHAAFSPQGWVARITPSGTVTEFSNGLTEAPGSITAGSDGNLWFTEPGGGIGRITTSGEITEIANASGGGHDITAGPDGNLWFTEYSSNLIGRVTPEGVLTEFPGVGSGSITTGADGNLWVAESSYHGIGGNPGGGTPRGGNLVRVTPSGSVTQYCELPEHTEASAIAAGPDGNLWFPAYGEGGPYIGRVSPSDAEPPVACTDGGVYESGDVRVSGHIAGQSGPGTAHFEYGTTTTYGTSTPTQSAGAGSTMYPNAAIATGSLRPSSIYHYRIVFRRADGVFYGDDQTFVSDSDGRVTGRAYVATTRATVDTRGAARIKLSCTTNTGPCKGRLILTKRLRVPIPHSRRTRAITVKLATATWSIPGGRTTPVRIILSRRGRRLLARAPHRRLAVRAIAASQFNVARRAVTLVGHHH